MVITSGNAPAGLRRANTTDDGTGNSGLTFSSKAQASTMLTSVLTKRPLRKLAYWARLSTPNGMTKAIVPCGLR